MSKSKEDIKTEGLAIAYAKTNKKLIARRLTNREIYPSEHEPVSVFMAGSPGAGKTEASKALLDRYETDDHKVLRIDPDELRNEFDQYTGSNSHLFQRGVSILVEKIHDFALKQKQSFLLDGTLSSFDVAKKNIERSLKRNRFVQILYVYQEPEQAWQFVQAREKVEGRMILPEHFINQYFLSRDTVNQLKQEFQGQINIDLLLKNIDGSNRAYEANISNIDNYIPEKYTRVQLESLIALD